MNYNINLSAVQSSHLFRRTISIEKGWRTQHWTQWQVGIAKTNNFKKHYFNYLIIDAHVRWWESSIIHTPKKIRWNLLAGKKFPLYSKKLHIFTAWRCHCRRKQAEAELKWEKNRIGIINFPYHSRNILRISKGSIEIPPGDRQLSTTLGTDTNKRWATSVQARSQFKIIKSTHLIWKMDYWRTSRKRNARIQARWRNCIKDAKVRRVATIRAYVNEH